MSKSKTTAPAQAQNPAVTERRFTEGKVVVYDVAGGPLFGGRSNVPRTHHHERLPWPCCTRREHGLGGIRDLSRITDHFEALFREHCEAIPQGRGTDEKQLQSFLIRESYRHERSMEPMNTAAQAAGLDLGLVFVTDEIPLPGDDGERIVCDILALRRDKGGRQVPVVVELKSERALTRLLAQVEGYARLVDLHADLFAQLFAALLGEPVAFGGPCEKVIVWPSLPGAAPEPRAAELTARGVVVVGYEQDGEQFEFQMSGRRS